MRRFPMSHVDLGLFSEGGLRSHVDLGTIGLTGPRSQDDMGQNPRWYKGPREEAENGVVLHGGLYGPPYELPVGQNVGHGFSDKVISIIH